MGKHSLDPWGFTMANVGRLSMMILRFLPFSFTVEAEIKMVWDLCSKRKLMQISPVTIPLTLLSFGKIVRSGNG